MVATRRPPRTARGPADRRREPLLWAIVLIPLSVVPAAVVARAVFNARGGRFWLGMAAMTAVLGVLAVALRGAGPWAWRLPPRLWVPAVLSAALLYVLFYLGDRALLALLPRISAAGASVYDMAADVPRYATTLALLLVIGPGEELYWRGLIQWDLHRLLPVWAAVVGAAVLYGALHLVTRNPALVIAALVCGLFWGAMYAWTGNLPAVIVSHALWDCATLLWWPLPVPDAHGRPSAASPSAASGPASPPVS